MRNLLSILLPFAFLISGCASKGFNRGALQNQIGIKKPVTDDQDIKEVLKKKPNLPKPFKLAVYFKRPAVNALPSEDTKAKWRWTEQDKETVLEAAKELKDLKIVSDVFPILGSLVADEDLKSIRIAAAKQSADAVIVIDGAGQADNYINNWGWSYILIVTTAFVPGSESDVLFMTNAAMWDVRNEYLYLTAEAEGKSHETHSALFGKRNDERFAEAKTASLQNLKAQIISMVKGAKK